MSQPNNTHYLLAFRFAEDMPDPTPEQMQQMHQQWGAWIQSLRQQGHYVAGQPLEDSPGKVLRGPRGAKATDGPFAEAKEVLGGFLIVTAGSIAEATELAKGCPSLGGPFSVEVRQVRPMDI